jgi:hypothetical protein
MTMPPVLRSIRLHRAGAKAFSSPRSPLALLIGVSLDVRDEGVVVPGAGAVAEDAGLFVGQQDVLVLVDDVEPRRADLEVRIFLPWLFEKLVVDIKLQDVAHGKSRGALRALAVQLDAL